MEKKIAKIFKPNKIVGFLLFNMGVFLLIYVFSCHLEETPLAYFAYLLSTYDLIIFIIWFYQACKVSNTFIKENSKIYKNYQLHHTIITRWVLSISFIINLIFGVFKLITGIYYRSAWFITFAVYYLLLCFIKSSLVESMKKDDLGENIQKEYKKLKITGIVLLLLDVILAGMIILIIHQNHAFIYPGNLIYVVALYDFYLIITAFINVFKYRKNQSPVLLASKCINLTVAMISMISLEVAMIYQFGSNDSNFKLVMTSITGFCVVLINSLMSIFMIAKVSKYSKKGVLSIFNTRGDI